MLDSIQKWNCSEFEGFLGLSIYYYKAHNMFLGSRRLCWNSRRSRCLKLDKFWDEWSMCPHWVGKTGLGKMLLWKSSKRHFLSCSSDCKYVFLADFDGGVSGTNSVSGKYSGTFLIRRQNLSFYLRRSTTYWFSGHLNRWRTPHIWTDFGIRISSGEAGNLKYFFTVRETWVWFRLCHDIDKSPIRHNGRIACKIGKNKLWNHFKCHSLQVQLPNGFIQWKQECFILAKSNCRDWRVIGRLRESWFLVLSHRIIFPDQCPICQE